MYLIIFINYMSFFYQTSCVWG